MSKRTADPIKTIDGYPTLPPDPGPGVYEVDVQITRRLDEQVTILHNETVTVETARGRAQAHAAAQLIVRKTRPELSLDHTYTQVMETRYVAGPTQRAAAPTVQSGGAGEPVVNPASLEDGDERPDYDYNFDKPFDVY